MMDQGRINPTEYAMILTLAVIGTTILFAPGLSIYVGGRDAWIAPIPAGVEALVVLFTMLALHKRFPRQTPIEYVQTIFGKWVGRVLGFYIISILLRHFAVMLREFTDFTTTVTLTRTPPEVIMLLMLAVIYYGVRQGLEVLARVTQLVVFIEVIQLVFSVVALASKDIDIDHLYPLFEHGPLPLMRSSLFIMNWSGELVIAGFLLPFLRKRQGVAKANVLAVVSMTILLLLTNLFTLGVFGDVIAARLQYGLYEVARYISVANFLERLDPIVMGVWIMLIYCKLAMFCYINSLAVAQLFQLRDFRPVIGLICLVAAVMSQQMFAHQADMSQFIAAVYPPYGLLIELVGPLLLLAITMVLQRRGAGRAKNV